MLDPRHVLLPLLLLAACADDLSEMSEGDPGPQSSTTSITSAASATTPGPTTTGVPTSGTSGGTPSEGTDPDGTGPNTLTGTTGPMKMDLGGAPDMGIPAGMLQLGRWTLYDKDGMFVKAIATPTTYIGKGKADFGVYQFSCVYINFWDTDFINMSFELASGNPKPCAINYDSWKAAPVYFKDSNCTQAVAFLPNTPGYPPSILQVGGSFSYATATPPAVGTSYIWDKDMNTCTLSNIMLPGYGFYEYKPVPSWVLEIMDAPPYSMVLEY